MQICMCSTNNSLRVEYVQTSCVQLRASRMSGSKHKVGADLISEDGGTWEVHRTQIRRNLTWELLTTLVSQNWNFEMTFKAWNLRNVTNMVFTTYDSSGWSIMRMIQWMTLVCKFFSLFENTFPPFTDGGVTSTKHFTDFRFDAGSGFPESIIYKSFWLTEREKSFRWLLSLRRCNQSWVWV